MTIKEMRQNIILIRKYDPRPHNYMIVKNYIDATMNNFNWETMSESDLKEGLKIIVEAMQRFYELRIWKEPYKGKYKDN